jgi:TadE-like protein
VVEFALVLPMLLVLLLGVADFARVFTSSIALEATTRDAAEVGAIQRRNNPPPPSSDPNFTAYYDNLHRLVAQAACREARPLPNTTFQESDSSCPTMPAIRACVHDGGDPICGDPISGFASTGAGCQHLGDPWSSGYGDAQTLPDTASFAVEVRICYHFTTLFNLQVALPMNTGLSLGEIWLERTRYFVIDCQPGVVSGSC